MEQDDELPWSGSAEAFRAMSGSGTTAHRPVLPSATRGMRLNDRLDGRLVTH